MVVQVANVTVVSHGPELHVPGWGPRLLQELEGFQSQGLYLRSSAGVHL